MNNLTEKEAKVIINAYKNGVVSSNQPKSLCVGREEELLEFQRCLDNTSDGIGTVKWVSGKYGTGKTFLLNKVKEIALEQNFVVSSIQINSGFKFNNLEKLYYQMMHHLYIEQFESKKCSFDDLFQRWIDKIQSSADKKKSINEINYVIHELNNYNNSFSRAFLAYIRAKITKNRPLAEAVGAWITGEKNIPTDMKKKFDIIGNVDKVNMLDFLKAFNRLVELMGYSGIVVIVDELDLLLNERKDIRHNSYANIRQLIDLIGTGDIYNALFVFSITPELFLNTEKGIPSYDALNQRLGHAVIIENDSLADLRQPVIHLRQIVQNEFTIFTEKFVNLFIKAYPIDLKISFESLKNWVLLNYHKEGEDIEHLTIRSFSIKLLEILDIIYQKPNNNLYKTELYAYKNGDSIVFKSKSIS